MSKEEGHVSSGPQAQGELSALLEAERRLSRDLDEAERRGRDTVDRARRDAGAAEERQAAELEAEGVRLRARLLVEREEAVAEVSCRLRAEGERYSTVDDRRINQLAHEVVEALLGESPAGAPR